MGAMTRLPLLLLVAAASPLLSPQRASAQLFPTWPAPSRDFDTEDHTPYSVGGFLGLGLQSGNASPANDVREIALAGLYLERNRDHLHAGLALRGVLGDTSTVSGTLVGPRFSYSYNILHPYAEVLFGPNHLTFDGADRQGVTSEIALGLEIAYGRNVRWRVIEFTQGTFTGQPDSHPRSFSTGFVVRVP